jgi:hypothetical protein
LEIETLRLDVRYKPREQREEASPSGEVRVEQGGGRALLLVPETLEEGRLYPLITVLHGAGRQDEMLAKTFAREPHTRDALFLIPRSQHPSWDLIVGQGRPDIFEQIALPMRADLERQGYEVGFMVDKGGRHWPRGDFHSDALDWFFTGELPDDI